jgi:hypothetical protein
MPSGAKEFEREYDMFSMQRLSEKNLPKEKCVKDCQFLKAKQEMESSFEKLNEGCGIDYTDVYGFNIPPSLASCSFLTFL